MKKPPLIAAIALGAFCVSDALGVVIATVPTYDATTNANTVDNTAPGSATTLGTFTTSVATAHGAGFGGVASFDAGTFTATSLLELTYGGTKTLNINSSVAFNTSSLVTSSSAIAISGVTGTNANVLNRATLASSDTTFTFGTITGGAMNEFVTQFAFTILARDTFSSTRTFTATAFFSDGSTSVVSDGVSSAKGSDDTFYSFAAPAGHSILNVAVDAITDGTSSTNQPLFDDIAFITTAGVIPEPATALLGAIGALGLLRRRR